MLGTLFWVAIGAFVGWNIPQPFWAVAIQKWAKTKIDNFRNRPQA